MDSTFLSLNIGDVYEVKQSLQSSTAYIATITSSHLYGKWELNVSSSRLHSVQIAATTDFSFAYTLYQFDPTSSFGFISVASKPIAGEGNLLLHKKRMQMSKSVNEKDWCSLTIQSRQ